MNNGYTSGYFQLEIGDLQGDPLSPYLFILAIEILAIQIRKDPDIKGFKVNNYMQKLTLYADDITIFVRDVKSAKQALAVLNMFSKHSGLKMNKEKSEGMWLGAQKDNPDELFGIVWPKLPIKALGIYHSYDVEAACNANFDDKIDKLIKQLHWWKARNLSLSGRILIVKSLGISKFTLAVSVLHVPDSKIKVINRELYAFIWNGKTDKVKKKLVIQNA